MFLWSPKIAGPPEVNQNVSDTMLRVGLASFLILQGSQRAFKIVKTYFGWSTLKALKMLCDR